MSNEALIGTKVDSIIHDLIPPPNPLAFVSIIDYSFILFNKEVSDAVHKKFDEIVGDYKRRSALMLKEVQVPKAMENGASAVMYEATYRVLVGCDKVQTVLLLLDDLRGWAEDEFGSDLFSKMYCDHAILRVEPNTKQHEQATRIENKCLSRFLEDKNNLLQNQVNITEMRNGDLEDQVDQLIATLNTMKERIDSLYIFNHNFQQLQKLPQIIEDICTAIGEPEICEDLIIHKIQ